MGKEYNGSKADSFPRYRMGSSWLSKIKKKYNCMEVQK